MTHPFVDGLAKSADHGLIHAHALHVVEEASANRGRASEYKSKRVKGQRKPRRVVLPPVLVREEEVVVQLKVVKVVLYPPLEHITNATERHDE